MDDQLFHLSLVTLRRLDEVHWGWIQPYDDQVLYHLLRRGVIDQGPEDRPFDASTRAIRYAASLGDCLWDIALRERERVRIPLKAFFSEELMSVL